MWSGEILGVWINTENLTWSLSEAKLADILQKIDLLIDPGNMDVIKVVTLKTLQKALGKVGYLVMLCSACAILNIEKARFEKHFHSENELSGKKQIKVAFLSLRARKDLKHIRAVLASIREHPLPLENYKNHKYLASDIFFCGDASGKIDDL